MNAGPQRRTLAPLAAALDDPALFRPGAPGRHVLVGEQKALADRLGVKWGTWYRRLDVLVRAGVVVRTGRVIEVDAGVLDAWLGRRDRRVVTMPTRAAQAWHAAAGERFQLAAAADGTVGYVRPDGGRATHADLAEATGRSRGTVQHHLRGLRLVPTPGPDHGAGGEGAQALVESVMRDLAELSTVARTESMRICALECLSVLTAGQDTTSTVTDRGEDAAFSARSETRHGAAFRDAERGTNAAPSRVSFSLEGKLEDGGEEHSPQRQDARRLETRDPKRGTTSPTVGDQPKVDRSKCKGPGADVEYLEPELRPGFNPTANLTQWRRDTQVIVEACQDRYGDEVPRGGPLKLGHAIGKWARLWTPKQWRTCCEILASHIGDQSRWIADPAGLLHQAVCWGYVEYFPVVVDDDDETPERAERRRLKFLAQGRGLVRTGAGDTGDMNSLADYLNHLATDRPDDELISLVQAVAPHLDRTQRHDLAAELAAAPTVVARSLEDHVVDILANYRNPLPVPPPAEPAAPTDPGEDHAPAGSEDATTNTNEPGAGRVFDAAAMAAARQSTAQAAGNAPAVVEARPTPAARPPTIDEPTWDGTQPADHLILARLRARTPVEDIRTELQRLYRGTTLGDALELLDQLAAARIPAPTADGLAQVGEGLRATPGQTSADPLAKGQP